MVTVPEREASEIGRFQCWLNGEESLNFPVMRRTLVLTDETARHPFRASLPPHVRMGVEPRTSLRWRLILPGAALGGGALVVLQLGAGLLLYYSPSNPLLATFSVFIGFLLWFRLVGIVILVAASWVALAARDADVPMVPVTEEERRRQEHEALLIAARVRVRDAHVARADAAWWGRWAATRDLRRAEDELARLEAETPAGIGGVGAPR